MPQPLRVLFIGESGADAVSTELQRLEYQPSMHRVLSEPELRVALGKVWDIAISDFSVGDFGALASLRIIHELRVDLPLIVVSGKLKDSEVLAVLKAGAADHMTRSNLMRLGAAIEREIRAVQTRKERVTLEEQFRQSQKMEAIGRLAGGVAHDFNNLLTVISGYAHMIVRDLPHDDPLHSCVEEVLKAASRATSLTNQLLAFSRRQVIQPKTLDLNALVANMDRMLRRVIGEHIELETVLSPGIGSVKADAGQLEQVIMNLAVNARDAMSEGGKLSIRTSNVDVRRSSRVHADVRPGSYVRLTIADTGKGMDAEIMVHLFEPFYTSKETGKGTGLGLSTVYGIVKQSGGEIVVESEPGRGAIFNIYLPRITDPGERTAAAVGEHPVHAGTETILLVEDETGVRQLVREMLRRLGYKIHEASNGADAVRIFAQHQSAIDLLLT